MDNDVGVGKLTINFPGRSETTSSDDVVMDGNKRLTEVLQSVDDKLENLKKVCA